MSIRTVFMGSPEFSLPTCADWRRATLWPAWSPNPTVRRAWAPADPTPGQNSGRELGIPLIQPRRLREEEAMQQLRRWAPELIVVAAFGQILRPEVLELPRFGCVNVHASLLPRWRGAAPIPAAILHGDSHTGVTIMLMDPGVDTGPVLSQRATPIQAGETAGELSERLAHLGAELLLETLPRYLSGELQPQPQPQEGATYAPMLKKEDGRLDFNQPRQSWSGACGPSTPGPGLLWIGKVGR
jgi:methionyl-tRNA formyltransferase